jgi:hypothetical protein
VILASKSCSHVAFLVFLYRFLEETFEKLYGFPTENPAKIHCVAVLGSAFACIAVILIFLGLFQPSSNARKIALAAFAMMQYFNIRNQYRFPVDGKDPPESMIEMPIPLLIFLQIIAMVGALFSRTDGQRAEIVRNKKKAALYVKHAAKVAKKD